MNQLGFHARTDFSVKQSIPQRKDAFALILTPTRELAIQVKRHIDAINIYTKKYIKVIFYHIVVSLTHINKIGAIIGGISKEKQIRILSERPQIIVATPGRLWDLLNEQVSLLKLGREIHLSHCYTGQCSS